MQIPSITTNKYKLLKFALLLGSVGWGISFYFTFTSWENSTNQLYQMGATPIQYQPLLDYWLKMASSLFGGVGIIFFICYRNPAKYKTTIPLLCYPSILVGVVILSSALLNKLTLSIHPTYPADITFCFLVGISIIYSISNNLTNP